MGLVTFRKKLGNSHLQKRTCRWSKFCVRMKRGKGGSSADLRQVAKHTLWKLQMELGTTSPPSGTVSKVAKSWLTVRSGFDKDLLRVVELLKKQILFLTSQPSAKSSSTARMLPESLVSQTLALSGPNCCSPSLSNSTAATVVWREAGECQHGWVAFLPPVRCTARTSGNGPAFWILGTAVKDSVGANSFSASFTCSYTRPNH